MTTVCLAVMAKNEAHVIARCLASAKPLVDSWLVVDTGSTDDTEAVAREAMMDLPGEVVRVPWRDFGWNRTQSLELARARANYTLYVDADDVLHLPAGGRLPELTHPAYELMVEDENAVYPRLHLFSNALPWRFEGVVHEWAVCEGSPRPARIEGVVYRRIGGGARSRDPRKYLDDADALEAALKTDPQNTRSVFYLAQSYADAGDYARALANYDRRVLMGGWPEEVYLAKFRGARAMTKLPFGHDAISDAHLAAWQLRPHRAEPLYYLAALARDIGDWQRARGFALAASGLPFPRTEKLSVLHEIYAWRALDELAAAYVGLKEWPAAVDTCRRLLARPLPAAERARIESNLASAEAAARSTI